MKSLRLACAPALSALALALSLSSAHAQQQVLLNWDQEWQWMHPMGAMPPRPAGGADTDFNTTWYLQEDVFAVQYDGPGFGAFPSVPGSSLTPNTFDSGRGPGPVAYGGAFEYIVTPLPAGTAAEFTAIASVLTTPASTGRYTGYFRTTFTVPDDGRAYRNPILRYVMDDGGFVYLDGVPVLRVNMLATAADTYTQITEGKANTESIIRNAQLFDPVGSPATGGNNQNVPPIAGNAYVLSSVTSLAPGVHTLAISVHNESVSSSDIGLAVQLVADASDCVIAATGTSAVRNLSGDPENLTNDTLSFDVTVTGSGQLSPAGWVVSGPPGSSLIGQTGEYGVARQFSGVPISEFPAVGGLVLEVHDAASTDCKATINFQAPQRLGSLTAGASSGLILTKVPWTPVWLLDETLGTLTLTNAGAGADRIVESSPVDLSNVSGDVRFRMVLEVRNTSTAMEPADTFLAELLLNNGTTTTTVNLITPYDLDASGRINGGATPAVDEFNLTHVAGTYDHTFTLSTLIPDNIVSAVLVIHGVNDSTSETFVVKDIHMEVAAHSIEIASAGPAIWDNHGTTDPMDDQYSVPVAVTPFALPAGSTGWTSNTTPASGLYSAPNPVVFGPFSATAGQQTITLTDNPVTAVVSNTLTVNPPGPTSLSAALVPNSIARNANGPGLEDDTVTFQAIVTGSYGGPGYAVEAGLGVSVDPLNGSYSAAPASFTLSSVPASGRVIVTFTDSSYPAANTTMTIFIPVIYVIGTTNFGTPTELLTASTSLPAVEWVIDSGLRTISMSTGGTGDKLVESAVLDLSTIGPVAFSAKFRAYDTSASSNFENTDKFKAELIIDGVTVNLISQWDTGNGSYGSLGPNGPPDGYLNGYKGEGATNDVVEADYNLYLVRDEFNLGSQVADDSIDNTFNLAYDIPAEANSVQLKIYGAGISGSEFFVVSDILFAGGTNDPDSDSDGIPDSVETAAGLNPADPNDAILDADSDGQSNISEYRAGTSLVDSNSYFRATAVSVGGASSTVRWASVTGKTYRIQTAPALSGPWTSLPGSFAGAPSAAPGPDFGTQSATVTLPDAGASKYFLRVVIP